MFKRPVTAEPAVAKPDASCRARCRSVEESNGNDAFAEIFPQGAACRVGNGRIGSHCAEAKG